METSWALTSTLDWELHLQATCHATTAADNNPGCCCLLQKCPSMLPAQALPCQATSQLLIRVIMLHQTASPGLPLSYSTSLSLNDWADILIRNQSRHPGATRHGATYTPRPRAAYQTNAFPLPLLTLTQMNLSVLLMPYLQCWLLTA